MHLSFFLFTYKRYVGILYMYCEVNVNQKRQISFRSLYNHIKTASELRQGCDYSMFKQGIRPMWEDDQNKCGGRWLINLDKKQRTTDLDNFWLEILLCMIGEAFNEYSDDVCGAVVNVRPKGDKLGVWTSNADCADSVMEIGYIIDIFYVAINLGIIKINVLSCILF